MTVLPKTRTDLGYEWSEASLDNALEMLKAFLQRNQGKAYFMDVYASNNQVYRNIIIQYQGIPCLEGETESIEIQFNRDEGRQLSIKLT